MLKLILNFLFILHLACKYNVIFCIKNKINIFLKYLLYFLSFFYIFKWFKLKQSVRLRICIQEMGIIYIKFAQHICNFSEFFSKEIIDELKKLQTNLPPIKQELVTQILKHELKDKFSLLHKLSKKPIGVASIAQVHTAYLIKDSDNYSLLDKGKKYKKIAIKVIKPNIKQKYQDDINFLYNFAKFINKFFIKASRFNLISVINVFEQSMQQEIDLLKEAQSCITAKQQKIKNLIIPKVYLSYSTENVLVMEFIQGKSIDYVIKNKEKYNLQLIAKNLAWIFFMQSYQYGFFHADMHEGNILILHDNKVALLDFGIMGKLKDKDKIAVTQILQSFLECNYKKIAAIHYYVGYIPKDTNLVEFEIAIAKIGELIINKKMHQIAISLLLKNLLNVTKKFNMQVQPQLILLQKTTLSIEELIKTLDPNLNPWELAAPWIQSWAKTYISPCAILKKYIKKQIQNVFSLKGIFNAYED